MKNLIRSIFGGLFLVLSVTLVPLAQAQYTPGAPYELYNLGVTNNVPATNTTTVNLGSAIDCALYNEVALQCEYKLDGSDTVATVFSFTKSIDGTNYNTTAPVTITTAANGANAVKTNIVVTMGAVRWLKCSAITGGTNAFSMTNIVVRYGFKPGRKG